MTDILRRSTKVSLSAATQAKRDRIRTILSEYGDVCQFFIDFFWEREWTKSHTKSDLLKEIVNLPADETWLTARLRKVAAREAFDMCRAMRRRFEPKHQIKPRHRGRSMRVSTTIADLQEPEDATSFDRWLHVASVGNGMILDLPINKHAHFNHLEAPESPREGKRNNAYVIREDSVQFAFEIDVSSIPQPDGDPVGLDTGINKLATLSDGTEIGTDLRSYINRIKACIAANGNQTRARRALKHYMDRMAKKVLREADGAGAVIVEDLRDLNDGTAKEHRVSKTLRRDLGAWAYAYWLDRLEMTCGWNRVPFHRVNPAYTSQRCSRCGHTERSNRRATSFRCLSCGYEADADVNAACNILERWRDPPDDGG